MKNLFTLKKPVETDYLKILPYKDGILINDIPAELENVVKHDSRVDLACKGKRAFLVEHILGCLNLAGITSAKIYGASENYDLSRETHKDARKLGFPPSSVIGNPYGTLDFDLFCKIRKAGLRQVNTECHEIKKKKLASPYGGIEISPSDKLEVLVSHSNVEYDFFFEEEKIEEVIKAKTPHLIGYSEKSLPHVAGDVIGDLCGIGKILKAKIKIYPKRKYHNLTIGILRKIQAY